MPTNELEPKSIPHGSVAIGVPVAFNVEIIEVVEANGCAEIDEEAELINCCAAATLGPSA